VFVKRLSKALRADQFSNFRGTGILPVAEKHGQDARATPNDVTQLKQLIGPGKALRPDNLPRRCVFWRCQGRFNSFALGDRCYQM
jgi:hypothetical protein